MLTQYLGCRCNCVLQSNLLQLEEVIVLSVHESQLRRYNWSKVDILYNVQ